MTDPDTLQQLAHHGKTWADVVLAIWPDIRAEVLAGLGGFLAGWLGFPRPRLNKFTRKEDRAPGGPLRRAEDVRGPLKSPRGKIRRGLGLFGGDDDAMLKEPE